MEQIKKIPENIEIYKPLNREALISDFDNSKLVISSLSQPGIYNYYTNFKTSKNGYLFIKVYEITSNDRLSHNRIKERSKIKIKDSKSSIYEGEFTIYEGSWGYKYGSRIELWFKPSDSTEFKVTERNYIVEGWMR